jgi:hypothetical protein
MIGILILEQHQGRTFSIKFLGVILLLSVIFLPDI